MCAREGIMPVQGKLKPGTLSVRNVGGVPVRAKTIGTTTMTMNMTAKSIGTILTTKTSNTHRTVLKEIHNKAIGDKVGVICKEVSNINLRPKQDKVHRPIQLKSQKELIDKVKKPIVKPAVLQVEKKDNNVKEEETTSRKIVDEVAEKPQETETLSERLKPAVEVDVQSYSTLLLPTTHIQDIDCGDHSNLLLVSTYAEEIYKYLRQLEVEYPIKQDHLRNSKVTPKMRSILVDWLCEIHSQFRLLAETLYLSIAILDRFLQVDKTVSQTNLQLVGSTALFIASKYEEMIPPEITDFVYISKRAFSRQDVIDMEYVVLRALDVSLGRPTPIHFLRRFSKAARANTEQHTLAKYILELCLLEYNMSHISPSLAAASALYIALYVFSMVNDKGGLWSTTLQHYTQYSQSQILPLATKMASMVVAAPISKYESVYKKYSSSSFKKISMHSNLSKLRSFSS